MLTDCEKRIVKWHESVSALRKRGWRRDSVASLHPPTAVGVEHAPTGPAWERIGHASHHAQWVRATYCLTMRSRMNHAHTKLRSYAHTLRRTILCVLLFTSALFSAGCDHLSHPFTAAQAPSGKGIVYIYRPSKFSGSSGNFMILASTPDERSKGTGKNVGFIESGGYATVFATSKLTLTMPYGNSSVELDIEPGKSYYVRVDYLGGDERARLVILPESEATPEIAETKYQTNTWTGS